MAKLGSEVACSGGTPTSFPPSVEALDQNSYFECLR